MPRAPHGSAWDGKAPLVLTGPRAGWAPCEWGWGWFGERHGDEAVLCKQRAPIFDEDDSSLLRPLRPRRGLPFTLPAASPQDRGDSTLIAECSLRE